MDAFEEDIAPLGVTKLDASGNERVIISNPASVRCRFAQAFSRKVHSQKPLGRLAELYRLFRGFDDSLPKSRPGQRRQGRPPTSRRNHARACLQRCRCLFGQRGRWPLHLHRMVSPERSEGAVRRRDFLQSCDTRWRVGPQRCKTRAHPLHQPATRSLHPCQSQGRQQDGISPAQSNTHPSCGKGSPCPASNKRVPMPITRSPISPGSSNGPIPGCLGFEVTRIYLNDDDRVALRNGVPDRIPCASWVAFKGQRNPHWLPQHTGIWPVQKLSWRDLTLRKKRDRLKRRPDEVRVRYEIRPVGDFAPGMDPAPDPTPREGYRHQARQRRAPDQGRRWSPGQGHGRRL